MSMDPLTSYLSNLNLYTDDIVFIAVMVLIILMGIIVTFVLPGCEDGLMDVVEKLETRSQKTETK